MYFNTDVKGYSDITWQDTKIEKKNSMPLFQCGNIINGTQASSILQGYANDLTTV